MCMALGLLNSVLRYSRFLCVLGCCTINSVGIAAYTWRLRVAWYLVFGCLASTDGVLFVVGGTVVMVVVFGVLGC